MRTKRRQLIGVAIGTAAVAVTLATGSTAHASTRVTAPPAKPAATAAAKSASVAPDKLKYDGTDPNQTGCAKDGRTVYSHRIFRGTTAIGNVELRYSAHCRTAWTRVTRTIPGNCYAFGYQSECTVPEIIRNSDGAKEYAKSGWGAWGNYSYSLQLNDVGVTSYSWGSVFDSSSSTYYRSGRTSRSY